MLKVYKGEEIKEIYPHRLETHLQCGYKLLEKEEQEQEPKEARRGRPRKEKQ